MKLINKIKNFIFDAEDEEKHEKHEKKEQKIEKEIPKENKIPKKDDDDIIDDNDFVNIPPKKRFDFDKNFFPETRVKEEPKKESYQSPSYRKETKRFKPSPMISPVFGLINVDSDEENKSKVKKEEKNVDVFDAVRQKAYGTLTDEIEDTLTRLNKGNFYNPPRISKEEVVEVEETIKIKTKIDNEETKEFGDNTIEEEKVKFETIDVEKQFKRDVEDEEEDTKESDLFNLIETMYEGSEDKE